MGSYRRQVVYQAKNLAMALLPGFLASIWTPEVKTHKIHPTSYLDGLRGLAACAVFVYHYTDYNHKYLLPAWGTPGSSPLQLPYVRLIYAGYPMVHVFFIISGFALSYRPLQELHAGRIRKCHSLLASSVFRRPIRLFGPCLVLTLINVLLCRLGYLQNYLKLLPSLWDQLLDWAVDAFDTITWPWAWDSRAWGSPIMPRYNVHLWTIPVEYAHSMLLFVTILFLSRFRTQMRLVVTTSLMVYSLSCVKWAAFEFIAGIFLADIHHLQSAHPKAPGLFASRAGHVLLKATQTFLLLAVGWLMSWPANAEFITPGHAYLRDRAPRLFRDGKIPERFWFAVGAFVLVWTVEHVTATRRVLESGLAQYTGRISFALYIVQHPLLNLVMFRVIGDPRRVKEGEVVAAGSGLKGLIGVHTIGRRMVCWFVGLVIIGSLLVWVADVFSKTVDAWFVRMAKRVEARICVTEDSGDITLPIPATAHKSVVFDA